MLTLVLELYFAAVLGVSGIAKLAYPGQFAATLRRHGIFPARSVRFISQVFPALQIAMAGLLIVGVVPVLAASLTLLMFLSFLTIEGFLLVTKRATECGCHGVAYPLKVDAASFVASIVLVVLAASHLWAVIFLPPVPWLWRGPGIVLAGGLGCWLIWKELQKRQAIGRSSAYFP